MATTAGKMYRTAGVYAIVNRDTRDMYVGSATMVSRRWRAHRNAINKKSHYNTRLQRAFDKYGFEAFEWEIIEFVDDKVKLIQREQIWIDFFQPVYNLRPIANSPFGIKHSAETRAKMSASAKKRGFSEEHKRNISLAKKGVPMRAEQKKLLSKLNKGKTLSEETKRKLSVALKGNQNWAGKQPKEVSL